MVGLCDAAFSFDPSRGVSFATYATRACYNAALHEVVTQGVIHRPHWHTKTLSTKNAVGHEMGIRARNTREFLIGLHDVLRTEFGYIFFDDCDDLRVMLATLGQDDRDILESWCGGETQKSIGLRMGTNRDNISKRIKQIKERLKERFG